jgi:hypothetical protein
MLAWLIDVVTAFSLPMLDGGGCAVDARCCTTTHSSTQGFSALQLLGSEAAAEAGTGAMTATTGATATVTVTELVTAVVTADAGTTAAALTSHSVRFSHIITVSSGRPPAATKSKRWRIDGSTRRRLSAASTTSLVGSGGKMVPEAASCSQPLHLKDAAAAAAASTVEWYVAYDSFESKRNAEQHRATPRQRGHRPTHRASATAHTHIAVASIHS